MKPYRLKHSIWTAAVFLLSVQLLCGFSELAAQELAGGKYTILGAKAHYGFIIPHTEELREVSGTNPVGFQLDWSRLSTTQNAWKHCNCYAKVGASFTYFNYQQPDVLGSSFNLIAYAEPLLLSRPHFSLSLRGGLGITYLDQVYDATENPQNIFYSSPISFLLLANLMFNYHLSDQWDLSLAANYNHISNGGIRSPNKGMNFPTFSLGAEYKLNPITLVEREKVSFERWTIHPYGRVFATRRGVNVDGFADRENVLLFGLAGGIQTQIAKLHAISSGLEIFRDNALREEAQHKGIEVAPYVLGWAVGHHFLFGKFDFNQQLVYYLHKPFPFTDKHFYQRYELAYQFMPDWLLGVSLLAHGDTAQNIDVRVGFVF